MPPTPTLKEKIEKILDNHHRGQYAICGELLCGHGESLLSLILTDRKAVVEELVGVVEMFGVHEDPALSHTPMPSYEHGWNAARTALLEKAKELNSEI